MKRLDILIDFDGVIVNTVKMFIDLNNRLNNQKDNYLDVDDWDFKPCCKNLPTKADVDKLFNHRELYLNPIFYRDSIGVINRLNDKYNIAICTMGEPDNIINKLNLLKVYLPQVDVVPIVNTTWKIKSKDFVRSKIIIDDHMRNLETSKADLPILFEPNKRFKWNEGWQGKVVLNWKHFEKEVEKYFENKNLS